MKSIGVLCNCGKPKAPEVLDRLTKKADELGLAMYSTGVTADHLPVATRVEAGELANHIDILMALGGDGTMLNAVRTLDGKDIPLLGVNLGALGFMTSVTEEELESGLDAVAKGDYTTSTRYVALCKVYKDGKLSGTHRALNDVVIGWGNSSRVITLELSVNGENVTSYVCDGLIISTPTGSTGHSLSAGGPILHPETRAFALNVICPHALSARPLVLPDDCVITVDVAESPKKVLLAIDGQEEAPVEMGHRLEISRDEKEVRFIHPPGYSYFSLLKQKLHLRGSNV